MADDDFLQNTDDNPMDDIGPDRGLRDDADPPFSPPSGTQDRIDDMHPVTDTNIDPMERYDEGIEGAASVDMPGEAGDETDDPLELEE